MEDKDLEEIKWLGKKYKPFKDKNRRFRFTCDKCGTCCEDNQIMLNPYDLIRLSKNKKMSILEVIQKYLKMHIGKDSKMPILMIKMLPQCIFMEDSFCSVYEDRPLVCRSYPVGRMKKIDIKKGGEIELWLLNENCSDIPLRLQKVWTVKDWIENQNVLEYYEVTNVWHDFLTDVTKLPKEIKEKQDWQKSFFVRVYLRYDSLKERGISLKGVPDKVILRALLKSAKENLIPKK